MKWICKIKSLLLLQVVNSYNIPGIWSAKKSTQAKKWQGLALPVPPRPRSLTFMSIRTDQRFYSVNEALMATARKYSRQGDKTKAKGRRMDGLQRDPDKFDSTSHLLSTKFGKLEQCRFLEMILTEFPYSEYKGS